MPAPIYDNGSSLGWELLNEKVKLYITSDKDLEKYILKGSSEIHWENKKVSHYELIHNLMNTSHGENVKKIIKRVVENYSSAKIERIIEEIDKEIPESHAQYRILESRKRLIYKIITLRFEILRKLINEGV